MKTTSDDGPRSAPHTGSRDTATPTGDRADKNAVSAEPHQTPVSGDVAERAGERALAESTLSGADVVEQASYRGTEVDVGQQAATSERVQNSDEQTRSKQ
jgi:hypothetical protein